MELLSLWIIIFLMISLDDWFGSLKIGVFFMTEQLAARTGNERRQAYVSMVHTDASYVCGAIVLAHSIRLSGSTRDLVMLVDSSILPEQRRALQAAGWQVREIERIRNPYAEKDRYNEWNYSKFRLWQITEYDKVNPKPRTNVCVCLFAGLLIAIWRN